MAHNLGKGSYIFKIVFIV